MSIRLNRPNPDYEAARQQMVDQQIVPRRVTDERVLQAMREVPRHMFVPPDMRDLAYRDTPLTIGHGQTISQPYIVAHMSQLLNLDAADRVLEIGTGSGYQAAVLSRLAALVFTVERIPELSRQAQAILQTMGYGNIHFRTDDGGYGWPEEAPFDAIMVTAAAPEIPAPLLAQLKDGGRLVAPVGESRYQNLVRITRRGEKFDKEMLTPVAFVPLRGEHGWRESDHWG